jgi:hypothetical protein
VPKPSEQQLGEVMEDVVMHHIGAEDVNHVIRQHQGWPLLVGLGGLAGLLVYYVK